MNGIYLDVGGPQVLEFFLPELYRCYGAGRSATGFQEELTARLGHPWARDAVRSLVLRDERGNYLSYLHLHAVAALNADREVWLGGISMFMTPERVRGQGNGSALLRLTLELLAQEDVDGAYIWSGIGTGFFEPFGFRAVGSLMIDAPLSSLPSSVGERVEIRALEKSDLPAVGAVYHRAGAGQPLWIIRDPARWEFLLSGGNSMVGGSTLIARVAIIGDRIVAYILSRIEGSELRLLEFAMESPDREVLSALLASTRDEAATRGCTRFVGARPPGTWGSLLDPLFTPVRNPDVAFMVASIGSKLDLSPIVEHGGYWETDRI